MVFEIGAYQVCAKQGLSVSGKRLASRVYKELSKLSSKNQQPTGKMHKGHDRHFTKKCMWMADKHMKRCLMWLAI